MRTFNEIALGRSPSRIPQINYMPMAVSATQFLLRLGQAQHLLH
jgi:hypothetical protein